MPIVFNTNYVNNFPANAMAAFQRAQNTWIAALPNANVTIDVSAVWGATLPQNFTAICIPNAIQSFLNAPAANVWYPSALADNLANQDLQPNDEDMTVFFGQLPLHFDWNVAAGHPRGNQYDLESIALHELAHGLGFAGVFWAIGWPWRGSYGDAQLIALANQVIQGSGHGQALGFVLPVLNGHPSVYGTHIQDVNGNYLTDPNHYVNNPPSNQLGAQLIGGNLFFDLNPRVPVYAPNPFVPFTSIDHLVDPASLMRPGIAAGQQVRAVDAPVLQILNALGW
jgi:hypothetical protein